MQRIGLVVLIIVMVVFSSACSNKGKTPEPVVPPEPVVSTNDLSGNYTGTMTLDKINETFILSYRTPKEREIIAKAVNAEVAKSADSIMANAYENVVTGIKSLAKEGSLTLNISKNDTSTNMASGDYMFITIAYNKLLPTSSDYGPYWALFNDKRNGDMSINVDSKEIHLSNSNNYGEEGGTTFGYKLDGSISGTKITGTWSQLWDGTEVYGGKFEVEKTAS